MPVCRKCHSHNLKKNGRKFKQSGVLQKYVCLDCNYQWNEDIKDVTRGEHGTQTVKILLLDIETARMQVGCWRLGKQHIGMDQIIKDWFILGWSAKWLFSSEVMSEFVTPEEALKRDDSRIMQGMWKLLNDATIIIGHNIKAFDVPKINTRFIFNGILPPSPYQIVDTYLQMKFLGFSCNKLQFFGKYVLNKEKIETDYQLWIDCENGSQKALDYMEKYCMNDTVLLEDAYLELRPYLKAGVNIALHNHSTERCCSTCGSPDLKESGYYFTSVSRFLSFVCNNCGSYSRERVSDVPIKEKKVLLSPTAR